MQIQKKYKDIIIAIGDHAIDYDIFFTLSHNTNLEQSELNNADYERLMQKGIICIKNAALKQVKLTDLGIYIYNTIKVQNFNL